MKTFFASILGGIVALFLFLIVVPLVFFLIASSSSTPDRPGNVVLSLDLREPMADQPAPGGAAAFFASSSFVETLQKLDAAKDDPAVKGVFVRSDSFGIGSARAEELRSAFKRLRANGKFVIAHTQGIFGVGPSSLRSISAADEIWIQPGSDVMTSGVAMETLFLKGLFENISVTPQIEAFYEYKNAPNVYQEDDFTEPHREAMLALGNDLWDISLADIAVDRGLETGALRATLANAPLSAERMVEVKLADQLGWPEEASDEALDRAGSGAELLTIYEYTAPPVSGNAPLIAIVGGEGGIVTGEGNSGFFSDEAVFASDRVAASILEAADNGKTEAIVFRVDSPGGSAIASDQVWRAVERVQERGIPVVVSMGSVAASGGYYVSAGADAILSLRTTITGSIGVFGGKFAVAEGLQRLGIQPRAITVGSEVAASWNTTQLTELQRERMVESLKRTYDRFLDIVSEGREMTVDQVHEVARGRVWSGVDAMDVGLVDDMGGLIEAIERAKELADIDADTKVRTLYYPLPQDPIEALSEFFGASAEQARVAAALSVVLDDEQVRATIQQMRGLQSGEAQAVAPVMIER